MFSYHEEGRNNPVDDDTEANLLPNASMAKDIVQGLVSNFAENGVHHDQQTNGCRRLLVGVRSFFWRLRTAGRDFLTDWNRHINKLALLEGRPNPGDEVPKNDADGHGE